MAEGPRVPDARKKYRVELSAEQHAALFAQARRAGLNLKDYLAPFFESIILPETRAFLALGSQGPRVPKAGYGTLCSAGPVEESHNLPGGVEDGGAEKSRGPEVPGSQDPTEVAKRYILDRLEAGEEPTVAEVAEAVGMNSRPLGAAMSRAGLQARLTGTGNRKKRRYVLDQIEAFRDAVG